MKLALIAAALLTGCAQLPASLGEFRINESDIQQAVKTQLVNQGPMSLAGNAAAELAIVVNDVQVDLIEADGGRVVAKLETELTTQVPFIGTLNTRLAPRLSGGIELRDQAIYLVAPRVESLGYSGPYGQAIEQTLGENGERLAAALDLYFSRTPIYSLADDPKLKLASQILKTVKVDETGLSLAP